MAKSDLVALAALAVNSGKKITRIETGARAYDSSEFYKDRKPLSLAEKARIQENASLAAFEAEWQEAFVRRFG